MATSWSQLPLEILDLILQRLALPDCFSFHKVCSSWRYVFLDRRRLTRPPPCLIMKPYGSTSNINLFHSLHGGQLFNLRFPMLNLNTGERIVGSSMGWLVIFCYKSVSITSSIGGESLTASLHLLNPISNKRIPLPSLQTLTVYQVVLSAAPTSRDCVLVLSKFVNNFSVSCAWCRLGDSQWTFFEVRHNPFFRVIYMVFHRGKLYILGEEGKYNVYAFEPQPRMTGNGIVPNISKSSHWCKQQIVHSGGELLFVGWRRSKSKVLDLLKQVEEMGRWERLESLGDRALLVGRNSHSESFCTQELMGSGFESNCIYFWEFLNGELLKFSVAEGSCQRIDIPCFQKNAHFNIEWIVPQAWSRTNAGTSANDNLPPVPSFWLPPPEDTLKVNLDAGYLDGAAHGLTLIAQNNQSPGADMGVTSLVAPDAISEVISTELANM